MNTGRDAPTVVSVGSSLTDADEIVGGGGTPSTGGIEDGITGTGTTGSDRIVGVSGSAGAGGSIGTVGVGGGVWLVSGSGTGVAGRWAATSAGNAMRSRTTETR